MDLSAVPLVCGAGRGDRGLVVEELDVGQARRVVDGDVNEPPAHGLAANTGRVGEGARVVAPAGTHPLASAAPDTTELLDVDVHQLARSGALVAASRLQADAAQAPQPDAREDPRHRRDGHAEDLGGLWPGHPRPSQRRDRLNSAAGRCGWPRYISVLLADSPPANCISVQPGSQVRALGLPGSGWTREGRRSPSPPSPANRMIADFPPFARRLAIPQTGRSWRETRVVASLERAEDEVRELRSSVASAVQCSRLDVNRCRPRSA